MSALSDKLHTLLAKLHSGEHVAVEHADEFIVAMTEHLKSEFAPVVVNDVKKLIDELKADIEKLVTELGTKPIVATAETAIKDVVEHIAG